MGDLLSLWLSTIAFCTLTTVGFIVLAEWSAGGAAPWSIAAGVARGIHDWADAHAEPPRPVSTPATEPQPPIDTAALPLPPLPGGPSDPTAAFVDDAPTPEELARVEIEELPKRRF